MRVTKQGSVDIEVVALGVVNTMRLLDVLYSANLEQNTIFFCKLVGNGCVLEYRGGRRVLNSGLKGLPVMDVDCNNNMLVVRVMGPSIMVTGAPWEEMMAILISPGYEFDLNIWSGPWMHFHTRLGHLCFDTIIKMTKDPASSIKRMYTTRMNCLTCDQGKQVKKGQSKNDTGINLPITVIGGVRCSDLNSPMTPRDR